MGTNLGRSNTRHRARSLRLGLATTAARYNRNILTYRLLQ